MIDRKIEQDIKSLKSFMEFWTKFHSIFSESISKEIISQDDEAKFLETRDTIRAKYEELKGPFEFRYMPQSRLTDPVDDVLKIGGIRLMSEKGLKRLSDDWRDSYIFLNSIMERLKSKKKRLEEFNTVGVFAKRFFEVNSLKLAALFKKEKQI
jgi:hypothetical protein